MSGGLPKQFGRGGPGGQRVRVVQRVADNAVVLHSLLLGSGRGVCRGIVAPGQTERYAMDSVDEDVSARVLLQSVIHTESSRSPITRSASQAQFQSPGSRVRRSIRLRKSDVGTLTPQEALKQSIKKKLHESTSRFTLPVPPSKRRTISEGVRKINTPAPATASLLYDDDITPRYLLRGILQTEPETSLLVQDRPVKKEPELPSTNSSLHSNRPSTGLSDLDFPDMTTTVNLSNTVKGLSRKRPRRSLNITAFNRQLEHEDGQAEGGSATEKDLSPLSSASPNSITFSLKTPFVDVRTEKRGFQRKVTNRKKICLEEFDEALQNRLAAMGGDSELSVREDQQGLSETVRSEGFTLGQSDLTAPDITHDIITSNTALYSLPVDTATTFTITTQDKDTITGTQIQREMGGMKDEDEKVMEEVGEQNEDKMELDNKDGEDLAGSAGQREDSVRQKVSKSQTVEAVADSQTEEDEVAESQTAEDEVAESQTAEDEVAESQTAEDEVAESQTAEDEVAESQTAEDEVAESQTAEDEVAESQTAEDEVAESQTAEDEVAESQTAEDEVAESQTAEDVADEGGQVVEEGQEKRLISQSLTHNAMHISRRAYCSEGGVKVAGVIEGGRGYKSMGAALYPTETGWAGRRSEGDTAGEWHNGPEVGASESAHTRTVTLGSVPPSPLPQEDELEGLSRTGTSLGNEEMENSMPPLEITFEPENNAPHSSNSSLHPITAQSPAEHEEDWDDVEEGDGIRSEELSMKTPAFVREKRNALPIDPLATPTVLKDLQPSVSAGAAAVVKPKAVRGKRTGSAKKDPGLSKSYIMSVFKHFAKTKVSTDVYPVLKEIMERYFDRLADDLETFAAHAKRKTIEVEDVELLMRRQGFVTDIMPVNVLIEKYLPMESRKLLIPVATSGNYVIPKPRRK
ncbi:centromere protein T [Oncorhynchus tshawytscha]|uniref:centromere protein T n=1 Tax=Oncorhynchus tshawytscha TaxID=74940 RepID=UPI001C3DBBBE|nr:centromere protein T [Oncorhynchus tshawytscha]